MKTCSYFLYTEPLGMLGKYSSPFKKYDKIVHCQHTDTTTKKAGLCAHLMLVCCFFFTLPPTSFPLFPASILFFIFCETASLCAA